MLAPVREGLIEGRATGDLDIPDIEIAVTALQGVVSQVALIALIRDGEFGPHKLGDMLIPMVQKGLAA